MRRSNGYTILFAAVVCLVCSSTLTLVTTLLKDRQEANIEMDKKKNILNALGFEEDVSSLKSFEEVNSFYSNNVHEIMVDSEGSDIKKTAQESVVSGKNKLPLYISMKNNKAAAYAIPVQGKGLWSTIYGYLALEADLNTVKGITFYAHKETAGLGGEIDRDSFRNNFKRKNIIDDSGKLRSITIVKGKVNDLISNEKEKRFYVDGISGATMTTKGITIFLKKSLESYMPHFVEIRSQGTEIGK